MASPFKIFRKNAKVLLVGLFLLSMISFVVIPSFLQWLQTRQSRAVKSVVSTKKFGELSEMELQSLWIEHNTVRRFLESLGQKIDRSRGNSFRIRYYLAMIGQATEEQLVRNWLISQYAQASGIRITDRVINAFIRGLVDASGVTISQGELAQLLAQNRIEEGPLFAGLERELLVLRYLQLAGFDLMNLQPGYAGETPAMRWEYFLRFNRMASVEVCGIPVDRYYEKAPAPTNQQIQEYFEKYKTQLPDPTSPEPGFKVPTKVTVECLKGDFQKWQVNVKLTDEDLRSYYEQHKDEFFVRPATSPTTGASVNPTTTPAQEPAKDGAQVPPVQGASPAPPESPANPNEPAPNEKNGAAASPAETQPAEMAAPQPGGGATEKSSPATNEGSFQNRQTGSFRLVSLEDSANPEANKTDEMKSSSEDSPTGNKTGDQDAASSQPQPAGDASEQNKTEGTAKSGETDNQQASPKPEAQTLPTQQMSGEDPGKTGETQLQQTPVVESEKMSQDNEKPGSQSAQQQSPAQTEGPVVVPPVATGQPAGASQSTGVQEPASKYLPFEEVKDRIRAMIISERIQKALEELEESMRDYQTDWANYQTELEEAEKQKRPLPQKPAPPDFQKLAKEKQIDYVKIDDADIWALAKLDVGKSFDIQGVPFPRAILELREFFAVRSFDAEQNQYLCWVIAKTEEHVPELDDPGVRENVVRAWRMAEARKIADSELAALAERVNKEQKSLSEFRAANPELNLPEIVQTEPFTWLTFGEYDLARVAMPQPRLSAIKVRTKDPASGLIVEKDAVEDVSNDFMATVFALSVGETGKAWNRPQSVGYLVRVVEFQPPFEQLREMFFRQMEPSYLAAGQFDLSEVGVRWVRSLEEDAGLKWNRPAHQGTRE